MEQPVGENALVLGTMHIEVVPLEELVKDDFITSTHNPNPDDDSYPVRRANSRLVTCATRLGCHLMLLDLTGDELSSKSRADQAQKDEATRRHFLHSLVAAIVRSSIQS